MTRIPDTRPGVSIVHKLNEASLLVHKAWLNNPTKRISKKHHQQHPLSKRKKKRDDKTSSEEVKRRIGMLPSSTSTCVCARRAKGNEREKSKHRSRLPRINKISRGRRIFPWQNRREKFLRAACWCWSEDAARDSRLIFGAASERRRTEKAANWLLGDRRNELTALVVLPRKMNWQLNWWVFFFYFNGLRGNKENHEGVSTKPWRIF